MEYALLIGVILFLAVMAAYGYKRGFVRIVLSMLAMIVTIILASVLTIPVSGFIKETSVGEGIRASVEEMVEGADIIDAESINNLDLPKSMLEPIAEGAESTQQAIGTYVADALTDTIINSLTFLILVIVIYIILKIVIAALDVVTKLPVLNSINKGAGAVIGLVQGLLFVWVGCLVLAACSDKPWAQEAFRQINDNELLSFIYNNNMIIWIITKLL
ncbi:MAG: CvpA family protein [Lachnospiraceae bacterium]